MGVKASCPITLTVKPQGDNWNGISPLIRGSSPRSGKPVSKKGKRSKTNYLPGIQGERMSEEKSRMLLKRTVGKAQIFGGKKKW